MHDLWIVSKALLKNNYNTGAAEKPGRKSKKSTKIILGILLVCCMIPTLVMMYMLFVSLFESNLDLFAIETGLLMLSALSSFTILFSFPSTFFFAKDLPVLLPLPLAPWIIVGAKTIVVYISQGLIDLLFIIPLVAAYCTSCTAFNIIGLIALILGALIVPAITVFILGLLTLLCMRFMPFFQDKDKFNMVFGILTLVIACGAGAMGSAIGQSSAQQENLALLLTSQTQLISAMTGIFFQIPFAARTVVQSSFLDFVILLGILAACGAVYFLFAQKLYLATATTSRGSVKKKKQKDFSFRERSPFKSYMSKEFKILFTTPAYFTNLVLAQFILPIVLCVVFLVTPGIDEIKAEFGSYEIPVEGFTIAVAALAGGAFSLFIGSAGLASTAISREGEAGVRWMKTVPMALKEQLNAKLAVSVILSSAPTVIYCFMAHYLLTYSVILDVVFLLMAFLVGILDCQIGLLIDLVHPRLIWDDETAAIKSNYNSLFEMLAMWALVALLGLIIFIFADHLAWATAIITLVILVVIAALEQLLGRWGVSLLKNKV